MKMGLKKNPHYHVMLRLSEARKIDSIAKWFNVPDNFVNKSKSKSEKSLKYDDMLAYLIHAGDESKYQYDLNEIKTNVSDIEERINKYHERIKGRPVQKKNKDTIELERIINLITQGEIREFNLTDYIDARIYTKYTRQIKSAFEYRRELLKMKDRNMEVYYFYGESGSGKTTFAKELAKKENLSFFVSSSKNDVLDGYSGEDVIILDDLRPSSFDLCDLLKLLDNNTSSNVKSRYHNKFIEASKIIITSIYDMKQFFYMTNQDSGDEPIKQFERRCIINALFKDDYIYTYIYNPVNEVYEELDKIENPIKKKYPKSAPNETEKENLKKLFII